MMGRRVRLRYTQIDGVELLCPHCGEWLPIDPEHWRMNRWDRCLACRRECDRLRKLIRGRDEAYRAEQRAAARRYRAWLRRAAPEYVAAYDRERRARRREAAAARREAARSAT